MSESIASKSNEEINVAVAEEVMRWPRSDPGFHPRPDCYIQVYVDGSYQVRTRTCNNWKPSTDTAADYSVLVFIRGAWSTEQQCQFRDELRMLWEARAMERNRTVFNYVSGPNQYELGDYSRAALSAIRKGKQ